MLIKSYIFLEEQQWKNYIFTLVKYFYRNLRNQNFKNKEKWAKSLAWLGLELGWPKASRQPA